MKITKISIIGILIIVVCTFLYKINKGNTDFDTLPVTEGSYSSNLGLYTINVSYKPLSNYEISEGVVNYVYFKIDLGWTGKPFIQRNISDDMKYADDVNYLSDGILKDISIIKQTGDTVRPVSCITGNTYGMVNHDEILIAFDKSTLDNANKVLFVLNGRKKGIGFHKMVFDIEKINNNKI